MAAVKSDNPFHAEINKYFNIHVYEWSESGQQYLHCGICSANEVATYIGNEETKIRLFNAALERMASKHTALIRKRLKIDFYLK